MADITVSEIHPNPEEGFEWVEVYNGGSESISTSRLKLYDVTSKVLKINKDILPARTYVVATASAILNNGGDTVILEKDGIVIETITYETIQQGKSYSRCNNVWIINVLPTYEIANLCEEPTASPTNILHEATPTPSPTIKIVPTSEKKNLLAPIEFKKKHALSEQISSEIKMPTPTKALIKPQPQPTSSALVSSLVPIGIFSFIQCVFLVYLIIKRIRYD